AQIYAKPTNNSFVNLNYNSNIAKNDLTGDGEYNMESNVIGFGTGYLVSQIQYAPTKFSLSFSNSVSLDEVSNSFELTKNIVTLTANSEFRDFPLRSTMGYSISMDENVYSQEPNSKYNYHSIFLKYKYLLLDDKLQPFADLRISKAGGDVESSSQLINLGSNYKLDELTNLYAACGFSNYTYSNSSENDSNELNLKFRITRKF
ncbi:MAG: hypothetical protein KAS49_06740, partial [Candidatus Cloacimonetes bacterium]|nr:hypothetical protein [Candidatus Cloacimonadota bacterium]